MTPPFWSAVTDFSHSLALTPAEPSSILADMSNSHHAPMAQVIEAVPFGKSGKTLSLHDLIENAIDGIFIIDRNRRLVEFNHACESLTGYKRADVIGRSVFCAHAVQCQNAVGESMAGSLCPSLGVFQADLAHRSERMKAISRSGEVRWIETHYTPIHGSDGGVEYVMGILRDVTSQVSLEEQQDRLADQLGNYRREVESRYSFSRIVARSEAMLATLELAREVAPTGTTVLITGEGGTGKELLARAIHFNSGRKGGPFVGLNCASYEDGGLEAELFGSERDRPGCFERASGGTLFLDEVGEIPVPLQARLLRAIQEKEIERLGEGRPIPVDVRLVVATQRNLEERVERNLFRLDLFHRLRVFPLHLPPLRERREDIPALVSHLLDRFARETGKKVPVLSPEAEALLLGHAWEGNVRELQNVIERAVILCEGGTIGAAHLAIRPRAEGTAKSDDTCVFDLPPEGVCLEELEKSLLRQALARSGHNKTKAARLLGLSRSTLRYRLEKHNLVDSTP